MVDGNLIDRLVNLPKFNTIPLKEIEWLVAHGKFELHDVGTVLAPEGKPLKRLWIIISGCVAVRSDRGAGSRLVIEWRSGDVSGILPYSRMTAPPVNNYVSEKCEILAIDSKYFAEMIHLCPLFTAYTVHLMLDRARSFNASDLQAEKMISLGKLSAGLAHELNNPAAAVLSNAKMLLPELFKADAASRKLGSINLTQDQINLIDKVRSTCTNKNINKILSPLERTNREDEISLWLLDHNVDIEYAHIISETPLSISDLDELANSLAENTLSASIQWIATGCTLNMLAVDVEKAASRISDLVGAVKRFTYMDNLGKSAYADVEIGLRDTLRMVAAKVKSKGASVELEVKKNLPQVNAAGSDLNQVWMNLIDNALDAIPQGGQIKISALRENDRVIVSIADNGTGIPQDIIAKIFDPFFTTKPPGQGTGLGLDITRWLVRCFNGDIDVKSEPGSTEFRVRLPIISTKNNEIQTQ